MLEKDEEKLLIRRRIEKSMKIFLIFLAFVWLCTIISKSIYVSGLPIVNTDTASKKYVEHIVETDGIVIAGGEIAVNTQAGLRVDKVFVHQGDAVKAGDVLFTIDLTDVVELIDAKEMELSKLQCNLSDFQINSLIDAQKKEVAILWAKEDYETADKETALAKERAKITLEKAEEALQKHLANTVPYTADNARRDAWEAYHDWVNKGYSITDKITAQEREIQRLEEQLAALENLAGKEGNIENDEQGKVLSGAAGNLVHNNTEKVDINDNSKVENNTDKTTNIGIEFEDAEVENSTDTNTIETDNEDAIVDNREENTADTNMDDKDIDTENNTDNTDTKNTEMDNENTDIDKTNNTDFENQEMDSNNTENNTSTQKPKENQEFVDEEKRTELLNKIKKANKQLVALRDQLTKHDRDVVTQPDYSAEEAEYDAWQNTKLTLEENVQHAKESYYDTSYAREVTLRQKMREIAAAEVPSRVDSTAEVYQLEIKQTQKQIERLNMIKKQKGEIKAEKDGIISKIQIEVGSRTSDVAALLVTDTQRPCQFKFSITKEDSKYVHLKDMIAVKLNGQSSAIEVTVDYFTENTQGGYDIACQLPENVGQPGWSGKAQKTVQGEYHELTFPVEAVFEENNAYYIYTLNEKEGILGSEYYVEKIKVQMKDQNDRYIAVEPGTISADTKVVIYSTKELKQGQSVRPREQ